MKKILILLTILGTVSGIVGADAAEEKVITVTFMTDDDQAWPEANPPISIETLRMFDFFDWFLDNLKTLGNNLELSSWGDYGILINHDPFRELIRLIELDPKATLDSFNHFDMKLWLDSIDILRLLDFNKEKNPDFLDSFNKALEIWLETQSASVKAEFTNDPRYKKFIDLYK